MNTKQVGKILWWSERDGNGVICDSQGNEHYFDRSVINTRMLSKISRDVLVVFDSDRCDNTLVAKNIKIPSSHLIAKYEELYKDKKSQQRLPFAI